MHVLIIPSWYPFQRNLYSGIFIHEQALAIGAFDQNNQISLSLWGQKAFNIQIRQPIYSLNILGDYLKAKPYQNLISQNVEEFYHPCLSWYYQLFGGNLKNIIQTNENLFHDVVRTHGQIDLIHAHASYPAGQVAYQLSKKFNVPYIITEHMSPYSFSHYKKKEMLLPVVKDAFLQAKKVITVSPVVDSFLQEHGIQPSVSIPNYIDETFFAPEPSKTNSKTFTFFTVARMTDQKGIPELLNAVKRLTTKHSNIKLRIAGHGKFLTYYQNMSKQLELNNTIKWLGVLNRKNMLNEYQTCNCFVLPSYSETFGVVYIEAMACGKPVIATRCGGPESFVNGTNGILVEKQNVDSLLNGMDTMIKNGEKKYSSQKIRNYFLDHFSRKAVIPQILNIYKEAIK